MGLLSSRALAKARALALRRLSTDRNREGVITAFRGERGNHITGPFGRFYTGSPDVANTHALPDGIDSAASGGRVYRDPIDTNGFGLWDLADDAPTSESLQAMATAAQRRGLPGLVLENVGDIATPTSGKSKAVRDRQYLIFDLERILAGR